MGHCYNSTVVDADVEKTWATIRNFHELGWAAPVVSSVDKVGEVDGGQVGARRILNEVFHETLQSVDDDTHSFTYSIDDGPGPVAAGAVADYIGAVSLRPVTDSGQTFVVWKSSYQSEDSSSVADFCNPIYQALLAALKSHLS